jgi:cytoskeletal protein CcmA (bactofilin family)
MAANVINQITAANTFQQWLGATQQLIGTANALTNGNGSTFYANTNLIVGGVNGSNATLNVETSALINTLTGNTANVINVTFRSVQITENIATANISTDLNVGANTYVHNKLTVGGDTLITGDLTVSGNITLDTIGFDDLLVSGSGSFGNTLTVIGNTSLTNVTVSNNLTVLAGAAVSGNATFSQNVLITGDLTVSGNITLDEIGFDDLRVAGSANIANNLSVTGTTQLIGATSIANITSLVGTANTNIYAAIAAADASALAYSIALG